MNFLKRHKEKFSNKYKLHDSKAAIYWLAILSFLESSIFLLPVDVLYIPLLLHKPKKAYKYALIATIFSVLGGILGWGIGAFAYKTVALPILSFYGKQEALLKLQNYHSVKLIIIMLLTSGLVHLPPIKLVNIFAGLMHVNIFIFILLNVVSRTIRLYGLAWLISKYGNDFVQKGKNLITAILQKEKKLLFYILSASCISLFISLISFFLQYVQGLLPCKLCLIERKLFLFIGTLFLILYCYILYNKQVIFKKLNQLLYFNYFAGLIILINMILSFYHYGVERKFWKGPISCSSENWQVPQTNKDLLLAIQQPHIVPCDIVGGNILNISLTAWSFIWNAFLFILLIAIIRQIKRICEK